MGFSDAIKQIWQNHAVAMIAIFLAIFAAGIYFKVSQSTLLLLVVLACPLMHMFIMGGHGSHGGQEKEKKENGEHSAQHGKTENKKSPACH